MKGVEWSDAEVQLLHERFATATNADLGVLLNKTAKAVSIKAGKLGLKKAAGFAREAAIIARYGPGALVKPAQPKNRQPAWVTMNRPDDVQARATAAERAGLPAVIPADVKIIRAKTPVDTRFTVAPGEQVFGCGFSAAGVGRDPETGLAWGQGA